MTKTEAVNEKPYVVDYFKDLWYRIKTICKAIGLVVKDNPMILVTLGTSVVGIWGSMNDIRIHKDEMKNTWDKRCSWTDPRTGLTWWFERPLTNDENKQLYRTAVSETAEVLDDLDILK